MKGPNELLRGVDAMCRERGIQRELVFSGIEGAIQLAMQKHYGGEREAEDVVVTIDRHTGAIQARKGEEAIDPELLGRIAAQAAKQFLIQRFREAERDAVFDEYAAQKGDLVSGTIQRYDGGAATVLLGRTEALLPRGEQIPGEQLHSNARVKAVITEVKKVGHRVRIILSRTHPDFVRQLFEKEIPEIADRTIEIKAVAREAGYRTKVAVSSIDMKVDCVGACVGVRGSRIKNIVEELGGERIDIVRWNDSLQILIRNALQPADIEDVFLYPRLGRAIVLVKEDQLSLAIGRRGQNVRLASKLVGWDIEIMTHEELDDTVTRAEDWFGQLPHISPEMVEAFIEEGYLSYDDLDTLDAPSLSELSGVTEEQADEMLEFALEASEEAEEESRGAREAARSHELRQAPARQTPAERAHALLGGDGPAPATETPSLDSLLREASDVLPSADAPEPVGMEALVGTEEALVGVEEPPPMPSVEVESGELSGLAPETGGESASAPNAPEMPSVSE